VGIEPTTSPCGVLSLSYRPVGLLQEGQAREVPPEVLLPARRDAEGHQGAQVRRVGLVDARQRHASALEAVGLPGERQLVGDGQHDGVRAGCKPSRATLSRGVHKLGSLDASRKVRTHEDVVRGR